ncbi:probable E3 ubiquitin-protein ligase makorin-1 [Drosophila albomicans]|uniref:RING-type E3 ubiquitin transferase n=1 Tax=Drosophila albomicans TaxID=7291 RepID=A0A6P8WT84_DROAB|nr:probable E3 ubiquitin-protein ligase makorin-1 [Drosophila albomicans]XP_034106902.1 probable E3 ubiquitin-protein ligase makorin-1 [Drosophila albomicans]
MSSVGVGNIVEAPILNVPGRSQTICRYYLRGICRFGDLCRFSHDLTRGHPEGEPGAINNTAATKASDDANETDVEEIPSTSRNNWVNASIFVPGQKCFVTQSQSLCGNDHDENEESVAATATVSTALQNGISWARIVGGPDVGVVKHAECRSLDDVCPYESPCPYAQYCPYRIHMELCEMCDQYCLHPTDQAQRKKHNRECLQQHEQAMELSFAIAQSKDKTCGICFDTIMEKAGREKRFGILPNCNHIFCLECIRTWRQAKQFEHKITRACPECRVCSDFVCPSAFWVETKEEKDKLLNDYRAALGAKDCKYFKKGEGKCPFGNKCFYKHALPNGDLVDVGLPKRARKLHSQNDLIDLLDIYLWDYVDRRDYHWLDLMSSDISDISESDEDDQDQ